MDTFDNSNGKVDNGAQSDMFEDSFMKNLKHLQTRIKQNHVKESDVEYGDMKYIGDSTRKLVELKLMELETMVQARKKEEEWIRKREIRAAQSDRIAQARSNLATLLMLEEKGKNGLEEDIESNLTILREVTNIGSEEITPSIPTIEKVMDGFHVTEKILRRELGKTNIMEFIRKAKNNGWEIRVIDDGITLYRNGKRIDGSSKDFIKIMENNEKNVSNVSKTKMVKVKNCIKRK